MAELSSELPATGRQAALRPVYVAGFLCAFGVLLSLLSQRTLAALRRTSVSTVHLFTLILLGVSASFVFIASILVVGSAPSLVASLCGASIWLCIVLYSGSKALVYLVLLERLFVVHGGGARGNAKRTQSPLYLVGVAFLVVWAVAVILIIPWKSTELRPSDGGCVLSLRLWTLYLSLVMDCVTNLYLSAAFIIPVSKSRSAEARKLAHESVMATLASLLVTIGNAIALAVLHGRERMFVCLGVCVLDVTANAVIIAIVTRTPNRLSTPPPHHETRRLDRHQVVPAHGVSGPGVIARQEGGRWSAAPERWKMRPVSTFGGVHWPASIAWRRDTHTEPGRTMDLASISVQVHEEVVVEDEGTSEESGSTPKRPEPALPSCTWSRGQYGRIEREWDQQPFRAMVVSVSDADEEDEPKSGAQESTGF